jgi:CheY-like chemotaxis protein
LSVVGYRLSVGSLRHDPLPERSNREPTTENRKPKSANMPDAARPITILLADDDEEDRMLTADALAESRVVNDLRFVEDGEELLDYLYRRGKFSGPHAAPPPGLILLDLNMPKKDGREALREIKADPELRRIPVIVLTTSKAEEDIYRTYDLGANSFISKPVQFASLVDVMKEIKRYWIEIVELPGSSPDSRNGR